MNSPITIHLEREATDRPWGFRLQGLIVDSLFFLLSLVFFLYLGGSDFSIPLSIQLVCICLQDKEKILTFFFLLLMCFSHQG